MMRVSLGHRFLQIEANLAVSQVGAIEPTNQRNKGSGQVAAPIDLDFVVMGRSARAAIANGRRPPRIRTGRAVRSSPGTPSP